MSTSTVLLVVIILVLVFSFFAIISIYNGLIRKRNYYKNNYAQIDVQLNRRYDLIPNLVESAKAYMQHEAGTLEKVVQARNEAQSIANQLSNNPLDNELMGKLIASENGLGKSMMNFKALMENYPDLKANENIKQLMEELSSTENKISFARQAYNDSVMHYNSAREVFLANIFAAIFQFHTAAYFEIEEMAKGPVKVSFN